MAIPPKAKTDIISTKDDPRWFQITNKDADGQFVYAVITTGIYCRPGCPSRHPNADNVRFFNLAKEAENAGFRACKRCHPQHKTAQTLEATRITQLCHYIEQADHEPNLAELATYIGIRGDHLQRVFKKAIGISPKAYAKRIRNQRLQHLIHSSDSVTQVMACTGYNSNSHFYKESQELLGMAATQYRNRGTAMQIDYMIGLSSIGQVLVAWSTKGICALLLGDDRQDLIEELQQRFANATRIQADNTREQSLKHIIKHIEQPQNALDLPLDIRGTAFQQRVWQALQKIPLGETRSYTDIAADIGSPKSVRAVAGACAANAIAVIIPCHRVLRQDGNLSGYRWGVERKRELLKIEQQRTPDSP